MTATMRRRPTVEPPRIVRLLVVVNACTATLSVLLLVNWGIEGWPAPEPRGLLLTLPLLLLQLFVGLLPAVLAGRQAPGRSRTLLLTLAVAGPAITVAVSVLCALAEGPW